MMTAGSELIEVPIPHGWRLVPLWALFSREKVLGHVHEPMLSVFREHGVVRKDSLPNLNKTAEDRSIYQLVDDGWLVVNRMKAFQGSVGVTFQRGIVSGHYICFRPHHKESSRYLNWLLRSDVYRTIFHRLSRGVRPGQSEIDNEYLRNVPVSLPPLDVQRRIADFLDDQVHLIDGVLSRRADQLGKLSERTIALVDGHLLREEDRTVKLAHVATLQTGLALNSNAHVDGGQLRPYLRVANVKAWGLDLTEVKEVMVSEEQIRRHTLRPGDVLMTEGGDRDKLGRGTLWQGEVTGALHQNHVFAVRPRDERLDARYLSFLTQSSVAREYFEATGNQSTNLASTNASTVMAFSFPLPSHAVQQQMVSSLERDLLHQDRLRGAIEQSMKSLYERKRSLITAAVTGAFDVTSASSRAADVALSGAGGVG